MAPQRLEPRIWLIAGPTASGKSALALRFAQAVGGEVVNADSMQLYRDLRLLTARPSPAEEAAAPHHLFGIADAGEAWSVGRWLRAVSPLLAEIGARGRPAIVVGGTGLYFTALTRGLADAPAADPAARRAAEQLFETLGEAEFRRRLMAADEGAASIAPGDRQRLTRLHEVAARGGETSSVRRSKTRPALAPGTWAGVVLEPPRAALYARCDARLAAMVEAGALEEVRALLARGLSPSLPAMKAVGVRELAEALADRATLAEALARAQQSTRRFVKRQLTWFRNQTPGWPRIVDLDAEAQWRDLARMARLA